MSLVAEASKYLSRAVGLAPAPVDVDVVRMGDDGWRVSLQDPDRSPFALLGFVTLTDGWFVVRSIARPCAETQTETLAEAIDALRPSAAEVPTLLAGVHG